MENTETIKIFSQCPKCGHWSAANATTSWIDKTSLVGSLIGDVEDEEVKKCKTKLGKVGTRLFWTIEHVPVTLFLGHNVNKNEIARFKCSCGEEWVDLGYSRDDLKDKIEKDIELSESKVPIEKTYEMLRAIYNYMGIDEQYSTKLNVLYTKLKTAYIRDFSKMPNYARRFVWITRNNIISYPENICLLTLNEACTVDTHFVNEVIGDTLYRKHPYKNIYYPTDSYCISLFEDEVEDFIDIMACIGAQKIKISANDELKDDKSQKDTSSTILKGNHKGIEVQASENYENEEERNFKRLIKSMEEHHFDSEGRVRRLPQQGEYAWFEKWRRKASRVIEHNERTMDFTLSIQEELFISQKEMDAIQVDIKNLATSSSASLSNTETSQETYKRFHRRELIAHVEFYSESEIKKEGHVKSFFRKVFTKND